jgi:hypothetical protein
MATFCSGSKRIVGASNLAFNLFKSMHLTTFGKTCNQSSKFSSLNKSALVKDCDALSKCRKGRERLCQESLEDFRTAIEINPLQLPTLFYDLLAGGS